MIKVAVCGANGKMGKEVVKALTDNSEMEFVAGIDLNNAEFETIEKAHKSREIDVLVDFTQPSIIYQNALYCLNSKFQLHRQDRIHSFRT